MARSIEEIQADITRVKAEMALRDKYERGFNQPQTKVGWGSYIVNGDRGLLDAYQNRENQWKNMQEQQAYQAKQNALARKFQMEQAERARDFQASEADINREFNREQNELNRDLQERLADKSRANASEDKTDAARLKYQQLLIEREEIKRKGGDTRLVDAELEHIKNKYGFESPETKPFDPKNTIEYKLAKYSRISDKNTLDEIQEAMDTLAEYDTPEAIKRYAELEEVFDKRAKYEEGKEYRKLQIKNWNGTELSSWLINHDYTQEESGAYIVLKNKAGKEIKRVKKPKTTAVSETAWPD